jgi:tricarballylate dehydrogenase
VSGVLPVVVVGAGNAGLCAALAASEQGASVVVLEKADVELRGGDTAFTGGLYRFPFDDPSELAELLGSGSAGELSGVEIPSYTKRAYLDDLDRTTEGLGDTALHEILVDDALPTMRWLTAQGIRWVLAIGRQAFQHGTRKRFTGNLILEAVGGGPGLSDRLFQRAEARGITVRHATAARRLVLDRGSGRVVGVEVKGPDGLAEIPAAAVVLAAGGFQADREMRARYLGPDWDLAKVRGTRFNTGDGIRMALEIGAEPYGHWSSCHAVAWDLMAPPVGDLRVGDLYQKHSYPLGIVVNELGQRFIDEGADFRNYTYAKYGREIMRQPGRRAFQIFDRKTVPLLRDEYRIRDATRARGSSLAEVAETLFIAPAELQRTVDEFNASITERPFDPSVLDGRSALPRGQPPKSNWAQRIDEPPFEGYAVTCGITFTFGGVRISGDGEVLDVYGRPLPGLFAAGEMVGGLFYFNYPGGAGLMAGSVFGRRAGRSAAAFPRAGSRSS